MSAGAMAQSSADFSDDEELVQRPPKKVNVEPPQRPWTATSSDSTISVNASALPHLLVEMLLRKWDAGLKSLLESQQAQRAGAAVGMLLVAWLLRRRRARVRQVRGAGEFDDAVSVAVRRRKRVVVQLIAPGCDEEYTKALEREFRVASRSPRAQLVFLSYRGPVESVEPPQSPLLKRAASWVADLTVSVLATAAETAGIMPTWQVLLRSMQDGRLTYVVVKGDEFSSSVVTRLDRWEGNVAADRQALREFLHSHSHPKKVRKALATTPRAGARTR